MARTVSTRFVPSNFRSSDMYAWTPVAEDNRETPISLTAVLEIDSANSVMELRRLKTRERVRRYRERQNSRKSRK